jgi:hypothetical protein
MLLKGGSRTLKDAEGRTPLEMIPKQQTIQVGDCDEEELKSIL